MTGDKVSYMALPKGVRILTSDGEELGRVSDVIADDQKDIFSGITFKDGVLGGERFVPADAIEDMTTEEVTVAMTAAEAKEKLEPYEG